MIRNIAGMLILLLCCGCTARPQPVVSTDSAQIISAEKQSMAVATITKASKISELPSSGALAGKIICLDPGHAVTAAKKQERISPLSDTTKPAYVSGTSGKGMTEEKLNLLVAVKLRKLLEQGGAKVVMTRETSKITISNIERAKVANDAHADVCVHIHADGIENRSTHGVSVLIPGGKLLGTPSIVKPSARLGKIMVGCVAETTGAQSRGTTLRNDLSGFNWSKVPTVLIEMGFMTNASEDAKLESDTYQNKLAQGMRTALIEYFASGS